ncbi:MAG: hypothetical protein QOE58_1547, partial [Actinomycetota bacterium]|nr:hypothetical protein [Actinomycetota bacterium]
MMGAPCQTADMSGSVVMRRSLGRRLKALRHAAGKTAADVQMAQLASTAKLNRVENGSSQGVKVADVIALCQFYGADRETSDALVELAKSTNADGWWEDFGDVMPTWFGTFVELEAAATRLHVYDPELVYGLLQTPAYQRAVFEAAPWLDAGVVEGRARLRTQRQRAAFERTPPLEMTFVMGQGVLERLVGGPDVADAQRQYLVDQTQLPHMELRVLPWSAGAHPCMTGPFVILGFDSADDPDVLYLEQASAARYIEQERTVTEYRRLFDAACRKSIAIEEFL